MDAGFDTGLEDILLNRVVVTTATENEKDLERFFVIIRRPGENKGAQRSENGEKEWNDFFHSGSWMLEGGDGPVEWNFWLISVRMVVEGDG